MSQSKRRGLGRGLDALLTNPSTQQTADQETTSSEKVEVDNSELQNLAINLLQPGKYQPRKDMSAEALDELSSSIKNQGIIQPIVVRPVSENKYEIIAGERRWRAAQIAELESVPCLIKNVADEAAVAIALIENIQREDLNAMEEAIALERLLTEFELTHQEVADAVGKSRTTVSNLLRLNKLNDEVKTLLEHGDIEMGHARALLSLDDAFQASAARTIVAKELTVRETENLIKKLQNPPKTKEIDEEENTTESLEQNLSEKIGYKVSISHNKKGKGKLVISYKDLGELDNIVSRLNSF